MTESDIEDTLPGDDFPWCNWVTVYTWEEDPSEIPTDALGVKISKEEFQRVLADAEGWVYG